MLMQWVLSTKTTAAVFGNLLQHVEKLLLQ